MHFHMAPRLSEGVRLGCEYKLCLGHADMFSVQDTVLRTSISYMPAQGMHHLLSLATPQHLRQDTRYVDLATTSLMQP